MSELIDYYPANLDTERRVYAAMPAWQPIDDSGLQALAADVCQRAGQPLDALEIAALLESMGVTDEVAVRRYGAPDVFALAAAALNRIRQQGILPQTTRSVGELKVSVRQTLTDLARGPLSLAAIGVLLLIATAYEQFGRWGQGQVLAFSLGMTGSMFITNGFVQAAARRSSIYWSRGNPPATLQYLQRVMLVAASCSLLAGLLFTTALRAWAGFTMDQALVFFLAFSILSLIWLMASALAVLEVSAWFGACLLSGLVVGGLVDRLAFFAHVPVHLIFGTVFGLLAATATMYTAARRAYQRGNRNRSSSAGVVLPSPAYLLAEAAPYFMYGTLYMVFVLSPHVLAWLGRRPIGADWLALMEPLELGLSLAMVPLLLSGGVAENTSRVFWYRARIEQARTEGGQVGDFARKMLGFYVWRMAVYLLVLGGVSLIADVVLTNLAASQGAPIFGGEVFLAVLKTGLVAFWLLGLGLFNSIISISLARPWVAVQAVLWAMVSTWLVGLPWVMIVRFDLAATAFVVGAAAFAVASSISTVSLLMNADYHYFSSF